MGKLIRQHAKSSGITSLAYNDLDCILEIVFCKGGIYEYNNVSENDYQDLLQSGSIGEFFNKNIRKKNKHRKVRD